MQSLDLNLATRPFKNNTLLWIGLGLAVAGLAIVTTLNIRTYREHEVLLGSLRAEVDQIDDEFDALEARSVDAEEKIESFDIEGLAIRAEKANEVIRWKAFSWTRLFNLLQDVQPNDVQMASIRPVFRLEGLDRDARLADKTESVPVSVEGLAKDLRSFLELERALIRDPHFSRIDPERYDIDDKSGETFFSLRFLYDPNAVVEEPEPEPAEQEPGAAEGGPEGAEGGEKPAEDGEESPKVTRPESKRVANLPGGAERVRPQAAEER